MGVRRSGRANPGGRHMETMETMETSWSITPWRQIDAPGAGSFGTTCLVTSVREQQEN